jgi:hypothetical protein
LAKSGHGKRSESYLYCAAPVRPEPPLRADPTCFLSQLRSWSLTLYDEYHFFHPNALNRYSLGTKNKTLKYNADGSLTLYAGPKSPGEDKESNWLPAPNGPLSLYIPSSPFWTANGYPRCAALRETERADLPNGTPIGSG